jgi:hypothetical protein
MLSLPVADGPDGPGDLNFGTRPISQARVSTLSIEHDDLDSAIDALVAANTHDDLIIARLKKRRLQIRDEIAAIMAKAPLRDAGRPAEAIRANRTDADRDADIEASEPHAMLGAAPRSGGGLFVFGVFVTLSIMLMLVLGWPGIVDTLNQTVAQIYLLSLLVAANG